MNKFELKLEGKDRLIRVLNALPDKARGQTLKTALRKGAKPLISAARSKVVSFDFEKGGKKYTKPVNSKVLKASMGMIIRKGNEANDFYAVVGPRVGGASDGWFAHWIEYGTLAKRTEPLARKRRPAAEAMAKAGFGFPKHAFFRPAFVQQRLAVQKIIGTELLTGIKAHWDKEMR